MKFYTQNHNYYCGIDLHARSLYVCILNQRGEIQVHKSIKASPKALASVIKPYRADIVIGVECMFSWYWVADWCEEQALPFVLGHALYMKAIHGGKAKNDRIDSHKIATLLRGGMFPLAYVYPRQLRSTRDLMRRRIRLMRQRAELIAHVHNTISQYNLPPNTDNLRYAQHREALREFFPDESVQKSIDLDLNRIDFYDAQLSKIEWYLKKTAKAFDPKAIILLKSIHGVGDILSLVILYEIHTTFGEAATVFLRGNPKAQQWLQKKANQHHKAKALTLLAHKLGRAVYYMLKRKKLFDQEKFLATG